MKSSYQERLNECLKRILAHLPKKTPAAQQDFVRQFFFKVPVADLEKMDAGLAARVALSAFSFMESRMPGEPKIRAFTPHVAEHGYESRRFIVELLNDDMPFLVDSLTAELGRLGFAVHETVHPIFRVLRDRKGRLQAAAPEGAAEKGMQPESLIHFELSPLPSGLDVDGLVAALERVLTHIRAAVRDWPAMMERMRETLSEVEKNEKKLGKSAPEAAAFLAWLGERNFVFLGYTDGREKLGVCALENDVALPPEKAALLSIAKSGRKACVHRPALMDVITVQAGARARQFVGLFTSTVYYQSVEAIPLVRQKLLRVMERSGLDPASHDGKALKAILEFLPRDEIFQTTEDELLDVGMGLLALESKPGVRLFVRRDAFERFVSCMVFVPREYFSTQLRMTVIDMLAGAYRGQVENFYTQMTESALARLHIIIRTAPGVPEVDTAALETEIARFTHLWSDELYAELIGRFGEQEAEGLFRAFGGAFPAAYVSRYNISATVFDIEKSSEALKNGTLALDLYRMKTEPGMVHLKIYNPSEEIALSDILPMLENMGFRAIDEHPFLITPHLPEGRDVWIRDFKLTLPEAQSLVIEHVKPLFEEALLRVWRGEVKNDRFNGLVIKAGLSFRQVNVLRAYAKYLRQIGFSYAQGAIEEALLHHPAIAKNLVALFEARFNPDAADRETKQQYLAGQIETQLSQVEGLVEDRILRQYVQLIQATLRTNYFQHSISAEGGEVLSFKLRSAEVPGLPKPVPFAEIYVFGMRVEGIHLRGGKVARGGIRWSDRQEDFRTEVLGLMKAQMVKNSVIVPVGSKGGFVVKQPPAGREALQAEGIACYTAYLTGLLDITDNIVDGEVTPPPRVVRHDGDDPYLVVAADKGTASFSDIANTVSRRYGFWLDDAFASGGSAGYDHKKMAITARGAWVSVTRHFREMGVDIGAEEFTCAGIGDMSGDVFGNGMLLSGRVRLVAAFDHRHIFIDPAPDAKAGFEERKRLFALPRSSWKDYDATKISRGGGVYERGAKTISLPREAQNALGLEKASFTPDELIRAILTAPVDLLWNGGIGTYVKAETETHDQVGDRANNAVRVNGRELRCRVVGEGGNLGFTQKGRVEYARHGCGGLGGRINTDAIDNSGGVDCSDHEVNIKIAFSAALRSGKLTRAKRDQVLSKMADEVAHLVLKDNFLQTQAISLAERQGAEALASQARLLRRLERAGLLDRALESLPDDRALAELRHAGKGLSRPELAVAMAYGKIALYREIIDSSLPDEAYFAVDLMRYFPKAMQKDYAEEITAHPLRREIIGTVMTNSLVNRAGLAFFFDMLEDSGLPAREVAAAYTFARDTFDLRDLWLDIEKITPQAEVPVVADMLLSINRLIERVTLWALRNLSHPVEVEKAIAAMKPGVQELRRSLSAVHSASTRAHYEDTFARLTQSACMTEPLAAAAAGLEMLASAPDIIRVAGQTGQTIASVAGAYFALEEMLQFSWLRTQAAALPVVTHWDRLAARGLAQDLYDEQRRLTLSALHPEKQVKTPENAVEAWAVAHPDLLSGYRRLLEDMQARGTVELSALLVALKHVRMLVD